MSTTLANIEEQAGDNVFDYYEGTATITFDLQDTGGDGWNNNVLHVFTNTDELITEYDRDTGGTLTIDSTVGLTGWQNVSGCTLGTDSNGDAITATVSASAGVCTFPINESENYYFMIYGGTWDYQITGKVYINYGADSQEQVFEISRSGYSDEPWVGIFHATITEAVYDGDDSATYDLGTYSNIYLKNSIPVDALKNNIYVTNIYIDSSVTEIGNNAFEGCTALETIQNWGGVTTVGVAAFKGCIGLTGLTLPDAVTTLSQGSFRDCTNLVITLGSGISTIPSACFRNTGISIFVVPTTVTTIADSAFYECSTLDSVTMDENVTSIGNNAFKQCPQLSVAVIYFSGAVPNYTTAFDITPSYTIRWSSSADQMPQGAITGIEYLADVPAQHLINNTIVLTVIIGTGCTAIGSSAFLNCTNLSTLTFDNDYTLTSIGASALRNTSIGGHFTVPYGVTTIGNMAFRQTDIQMLNFPTSCTSAGAEVANECTSLWSVSLHQGLSLQQNTFNGGPQNQKPDITKLVNFYSSGTAADYSSGYFKTTPTQIIDESTNVVVKMPYTAGYIKTVKIHYYTNWNRDYYILGIEFITDEGVSTYEGYGNNTRWPSVSLSLDADDFITNIDSYSWSYNNSYAWWWSRNDINNLYQRLSYVKITTNKGLSLLKTTVYYDYYATIGNTITTASFGNEYWAQNYEQTYNAIQDHRSGSQLNNQYVDFYTNGTMVNNSKYWYMQTMESNCEITSHPGITGCTLETAYSRYLGRGYWTFLFGAISTVSNDPVGGSTAVLVDNISVQQVGEDAVVMVDSSTDTTNATVDSTSALITFEIDLADKCPTFYKGASFTFSMSSVEGDGWATQDGYKGSLTYSHTSDEISFSDGDSATAYLKTGLCLDELPVVLNTDVWLYDQNYSPPAPPMDTVFIMNNPSPGAFQNVSTTKYAYIHKNITSLPPDLFKGSGLVEIVIPDTVTSIADGAFEGCQNLISVTWTPSTAHFTTTPKRMFKNCTSLSSVTINSTAITTLDNSLFEGCSSLTSFTIPDAVTTLGNNVFKGCSGLVDFTIPDTVTSIGNSVCQNCTSLENLTIGYSIDVSTPTDPPEGIEEISKDAFKGCTSLVEVTIPYSIKRFQANNNPGQSQAFWGCSSLTTVNIMYGVTMPTPYEAAFSRVGGGQQGITFDYKYYYFGQPQPFAATNTNAIFEVDVPDDFCANHPVALDVTINATVTSIGDRAFQNASLATITFVEGDLTEIGEYAFEGTDLTTINIPDSVNTLNTGTFKNSSLLSSFTMGAVILDYPAECFMGTAISNMSCNTNLLTIGASCFEDTNILSVDFTDCLNIQSIGEKAFNNCTSLVDCTLPDNISELGSQCFAGCTSLSSLGAETSTGEVYFSTSSALSDHTQLRLIQHVDIDSYEGRRVATWGDFFCEGGYYARRAVAGGTGAWASGAVNVYKVNSNGGWDEVAHLSTTDTPKGWDYFGLAIEMKNGWIAVGAQGVDINNAGTSSNIWYNGAVYLYKYNSNTDTWGTATSDSMIFTETQILKSDRDDYYNYFGRYLSMNDIGYMCVNAHYSEDHTWGYVPFIFKLNTTTDLWEAHTEISDSNGTILNPASTDIYSTISNWWGGVSTGMGIRDTVMSDNYLLLNCRQQLQGQDLDNDGKADDFMGGIYVLKFDATTETWTQCCKLLPSPTYVPSSWEYVGYTNSIRASMDISESEEFIALGNPRANTYTGEVFVYKQNSDGTFGNVAAIGDAGEYTESHYIAAPSTFGTYDYFGWCVLVSGSRIYMSNPYYSNSGSLSSYQYSSDTDSWTYDTTLVPNTGTGYFGYHMDKDGSRLVIANYSNRISVYYTDIFPMLGRSSNAISELHDLNVSQENTLALFNHTLSSEDDVVGDLVDMSNIEASKQREALKHLTTCLFAKNPTVKSFKMSRANTSLQNISTNSVNIFSSNSTFNINDLDASTGFYCPLGSIGDSLTFQAHGGSSTDIVITRVTWATYTVVETISSVLTTTTFNRNDDDLTYTTQDGIELYISSVEGECPAGASCGDPHVKCLDGEIYDLKEEGFMRFYENDNIIINVLCAPGYDKWTNMLYFTKVFIQYDGKQAMLDMGFRGKPVEVISNIGLKLKETCSKMKRNAQRHCLDCKNWHSGNDAKCDAHMKKYDHRIPELVQNSITFKTKWGVFVFSNVDSYNGQPCSIKYQGVNSNCAGLIVGEEWEDKCKLECLEDVRTLRPTNAIVSV